MAAQSWFDRLSTIDGWPKALVVAVLVVAAAWIVVTYLKERG